jgi:hypothetical protein
LTSSMLGYQPGKYIYSFILIVIDSNG